MKEVFYIFSKFLKFLMKISNRKYWPALFWWKRLWRVKMNMTHFWIFFFFNGQRHTFGSNWPTCEFLQQMLRNTCNGSHNIYAHLVQLQLPQVCISSLLDCLQFMGSKRKWHFCKYKHSLIHGIVIFLKFYYFSYCDFWKCNF